MKHQIMTHIIILCVFIAFFVKGLSFIDPDFGWHIKSGEYFVNHGIPATDIFSYTMPSFPWVNHEWLTDIVLYKTLNAVGYPGLALIFSIIGLSALLLVIGIPRQKIQKIALILASGTIFPVFGVRPQVITWFFLAVLLKFLVDEKLRKKVFLLPIMFFVWSNLHGGFASGILILGVYTFFKTIRLRKLQYVESIIFLFSLAVTFINPYGYHVWEEVLRSALDSNLKHTIVEWMPFYKSANFIYLFYLSFFLVIVWQTRKILKLEHKIILLLLTYLSLSVIRHIPLFVIFSSHYLISGVETFKKSISNRKISFYRFKQAETFILGISMFFFMTFSLLNIKEMSILTEKTFYPAKAVEFLKSENFDGNVFSWYGWGGYLIWKYPEKKVFIDGRMPSLRWKENPEGELSAAFDTYNEMFNGGNYNQVLDQFNVEYLLLPKPNIFSSKENLISRVVSQFFKTDMGTNFRKFDTDQTWELIYEDNTSVIYGKT